MTETTETTKKKRSAVKKTAVLRRKLNLAVAQLKATFVERDDAIEMIALGLLSRHNYLFVGVHGTAKTALVKCFLSHVDGANVFARQCGSFTTVDDLFGPVDIAAYQQGRWARRTAGFLAESEFPFLDESMKLPDGTFNMLLTYLNEREFDGQPVPMRALGSATNWPEVRSRSEKVEAVYDRFALRLAVDRITDVDRRVEVLDAAEKVSAYKPDPKARFTVADLDAAYKEVCAVTIDTASKRRLAELCFRLHKEDVDISERRSAWALMVLRASAWIHGRSSVALEDFGSLRFIFWINQPDIEVLDAILDTIDQATVKRCIQIIDQARNQSHQLKHALKDERLRRAPDVINSLREAAKKVIGIIDDEGVTEKGRAVIRTEMQKVKAEVTQLHNLIREEMGLGEES